MKNNQVAENLKIALADSYALYLKTQNYHWNVTGANFKGLHDLFQLQYTDLALAIDEIAERIRTLGEFAPGTFSAYQKMTKIKEGNETIKAEQMVKELANDQSVIIESLKKTCDEASKIGDEVSIGMMVERMTIHEKNAWMLNSSI